MIFPDDQQRELTEVQELELPVAIKDAQFQGRINIYAGLRLEGTFSQILEQLNGGEQ